MRDDLGYPLEDDQSDAFAPLTDIPLERALVALIFADNGNLDRVGALDPEDLADPVLSAAFGMAIRLHADGLPVTLALMKAQLLGIRLHDDRTGLDIVRSLSVGSNAPNIVDVAQRLRALAERRRMAGYLRSVSHALEDETQQATALAVDVASQVNDFLASAISTQKTSFTFREAADDLLAYLDSDAPRVEITTGLIDLDEATGGWHRGEVTYLAGRPSMGKSTFVLSSLLRTAKAGHGVLFFSLEMTMRQVAMRAITDLAYTHPPIAYADLKPKSLNSMQRSRLAEASQKYQALPLITETKNGLTAAEIFAIARKHAETFKAQGRSLDLIVVDHLLKVRASNRYAGNAVKELDEVSEAMCVMAKSLGVAVVGVHQLNRQVETRDNKRPVMSDLRGSGSLEQDADNVMLVFRPAYAIERHLEDSQEGRAEAQQMLEQVKHILELQIAKQRNGATAGLEFFVDLQANAVRNRSFRQ